MHILHTHKVTKVWLKMSLLAQKSSFLKHSSNLYRQKTEKKNEHNKNLQIPHCNPVNYHLAFFHQIRLPMMFSLIHMIINFLYQIHLIINLLKIKQKAEATSSFPKRRPLKIQEGLLQLHTN